MQYKINIKPKIILYIPNILKSFFFIYFIKNLIEITETTKAMNIPIKRVKNSKKLKLSPNFLSFKRLAPNIIGIDMKNENSVARLLESPSSNAPIIVAPDLEVPGIKLKT